MTRLSKSTHDDQVIRIVTVDDGVVDLYGDDLDWSELCTVDQYWNAVQRAMRTGETNDYINSEDPPRTIRGLDHFKGLVVGGYTLEADLYNVELSQLQGDLDQGADYE